MSTLQNNIWLIGSILQGIVIFIVFYFVAKKTGKPNPYKFALKSVLIFASLIVLGGLAYTIALFM